MLVYFLLIPLYLSLFGLSIWILTTVWLKFRDDPCFSQGISSVRFTVWKSDFFYCQKILGRMKKSSSKSLIVWLKLPVYLHTFSSTPTSSHWRTNLSKDFVIFKMRGEGQNKRESVQRNLNILKIWVFLCWKYSPLPSFHSNSVLCWYNNAWLLVLTWGGDLLTVFRVSDVVQAIARDRMLEWMDHWSVWWLPCPCSKCCVELFCTGMLSRAACRICILVFHTSLLYQEQLSI